jgi:hypothetical protein
MATLEDTVRKVVLDLTDSNELFTGLDVSNKVKILHPLSRYREIREIIRSMYSNLEFGTANYNYTRTPITVTLDDGSEREAFLYHPASISSWDLDFKYDAQKRAQTSLNPTKAAVAAVTASSVPVSSPSPVAPTATVTVSATTSVPMPTARDLWKQLFATQPSMFPTK